MDNDEFGNKGSELKNIDLLGHATPGPLQASKQKKVDLGNHQPGPPKQAGKKKRVLGQKPSMQSQYRWPC